MKSFFKIAKETSAQKKVFYVLTALSIVFFGATLVYGAVGNCHGIHVHDCYRVAANNSEQVEVNETWASTHVDTCVKNANPLDIFVPTNTLNEWGAFSTKAPNVTLQSCPNNNITCDDTYCYRTDAIIGSLCNIKYQVLIDGAADPSLRCGLQIDGPPNYPGIPPTWTRGQEGAQSFTSTGDQDFRFVCSVNKNAQSSLSKGSWTGTHNNLQQCPY